MKIRLKNLEEKNILSDIISLIKLWTLEVFETINIKYSSLFLNNEYWQTTTL